MIPVANLYRLYCYAADSLPITSRGNVSTEPFERFAELLAWVLVGETESWVRRGTPWSFTTVRDVRRSPRGRVRLSESLKQGHLARRRLVCESETLTPDTPGHRVLKAVLRQVTDDASLNRDVRRRASSLVRQFERVGDDPPPPRTWQRLDVSQRRTAHLLNICQWWHAERIPAPGDAAGQFSELPTDERRLARVFERFVRNFYRREQTIYPHVGGERFGWHQAEASPAALARLPDLLTDVCLTNATRKVVVDAKWYASPFAGRFGGDRLHAGHLYQLVAYLTNLAPRAGGRALVGVLLYGGVRPEVTLDYRLQGFAVRVASVDLSAEWAAVHDRLLNVVRWE